MIVELKKNKQPLYQLSEDDASISLINQSRTSADKNYKLSLLADTIPKEVTVEARNSIKKK